MTSNPLPYRQNVCMLIFNQDFKLFLGERAGESGIWQFPQGGVEDDSSSIEQNVYREAEEELGAPASLFKIERKLKHSHQYDFDNPPAYSIGKFRGQKQSFWLVRFLGNDSEIILDKYHAEFQSWCWADIELVKSKAEKKRLPGYLGALLEFETYKSTLIA